MKGTFFTSEIIELLSHRAPSRVTPQFRLQNFLLGNPAWETSREASLHIGEQGELRKLTEALGKERVAVIDDAKAERAKKVPGGALLFPTKSSWGRFVKLMRTRLGETITLTVNEAPVFANKFGEIKPGTVVKFKVENQDSWAGDLLGVLVYDQGEFKIKTPRSGTLTISKGLDVYSNTIEPVKVRTPPQPRLSVPSS